MKKIILLLLVSSKVFAQQKFNAEEFENFQLFTKVEDQEKFYHDLLKKDPLNDSNKVKYGPYQGQLAIEWLAKGNIEKYRQYMEMAPALIPTQHLLLTNVLESWVDEGKNLELVDEISRDFLNKFETGALKDIIFRTQTLLEVEALAKCKLGNPADALKLIEKSSEVKDGMRNVSYFRNSKANYLYRYATILSANGQDLRALDTLAAAVVNAQSNARVIATLKNIYAKLNGNSKSADGYVDSLKNVAYQKIYQEVLKTWHADAKQAPKFALKTLNGKTVRPSDLKGKIWVADFWTTMCKPCVACFPAFERIVAENKKDQFQLYVIDLFEDKKTVESYVNKNHVTLDVLLDPENISGTGFSIMGTPHMFVIDPRGYIRFDHVGYAGSDDKEYYTLKAMVDITKERSNNKKSVTLSK